MVNGKGVSDLKNQKGYTLVETMISVALGTLVIAAIGSTLDAGIFTAVDNRSRLYATNALREELETLRRTNFDTMVNYGASSSFSNAQVTHLDGGSGTLAIASSLGSDIKKITLTVAWTSRKGQALSQSITTYISRKGLNGS